MKKSRKGFFTILLRACLVKVISVQVDTKVEEDAQAILGWAKQHIRVSRDFALRAGVSCHVDVFQDFRKTVHR